MIRILVADDHTVVREGVRQILAGLEDMRVEDEAEDGQETLEKVMRGNCDMVLLDISMPGRSGLEVLDDILNIRPKLPVLILSMHPEEQYAVRALRAGASGYLTKASAAHELIGAIRKVTRGGKYVTASLAEKLARELDSKADKQRHEKLSNRRVSGRCSCWRREKRVSEISGELCLSVKTVSTYRTRIMDKMGMKKNAELTFYAMNNRLLNL